LSLVTLSTCQVSFLDVLGCFGGIPEEKLCLVFEGLQREGLLQVRASTFVDLTTGLSPHRLRQSGNVQTCTALNPCTTCTRTCRIPGCVLTILCSPAVPGSNSYACTVLQQEYHCHLLTSYSAYVLSRALASSSSIFVLWLFSQAVPGSDGYTYTVLQQEGAEPLPPHHDSQAVDDQAMEMDADADMDADVAADGDVVVTAAEGAGGLGDSWQEPGSGNMRVQQEQAISQMMTGLSMGGGAGGRSGAAGVRGVNASVLGKDMHAGAWSGNSCHLHAICSVELLWLR
jgi:hypothetical protein